MSVEGAKVRVGKTAILLPMKVAKTAQGDAIPQQAACKRRRIVEKMAVRVRIRGKSSPAMMHMWRGANAKAAAAGGRACQASTSLSLSLRSTFAPKECVHLVLERRWLGLGEKAQRSSLGRRSLTGPVLEGWGIRVRDAFKDKTKAQKALGLALMSQTEVERDGGLRERAHLFVQTFEVQGSLRRGSSELNRRVYVVSSSIGETFSNQLLPPGLVEYEGNYFYMSDEAEDLARRSEESLGTPWGYPHNSRNSCSRPGEVLKVFASPVGEFGANAYATGSGLVDVQVPGLQSLDHFDLAKAVTYSSPEGLAQVRMQRADRKGAVRVLLTVREHILCDTRPVADPWLAQIAGG